MSCFAAASRPIAARMAIRPKKHESTQIRLPRRTYSKSSETLGLTISGASQEKFRSRIFRGILKSFQRISGVRSFQLVDTTRIGPTFNSLVS